MCPVTLTALGIGAGLAGSGAAAATAGMTAAAITASAAATAAAGTAVVAGSAAAGIATAASALAVASTVSTVMTVGGTLLSIGGMLYQSKTSSDTQNRQIREKYRQQEHQNKLANEALKRDYEQANIKKVELQKQAGAKEDEITLATKVEQAETRNSAGEAGMAGLSIDNLLDSVAREGLYDGNTVSSNLAMNVAQIDRNTQSSRLKYKGRVDDSKYFVEDNSGSLMGALGSAATGAAAYG